MRLPELNWQLAIDGLAIIEPGGPLLQRAIAALPARPSFDRGLLSRHADWLVDIGLLDEKHPGGALVHTQASRAIRLVLRAAAAFEIDPSAAGDLEACVRRPVEKYLARNFTVEQRHLVLGERPDHSTSGKRRTLDEVLSARRVRAFLGLEEAAAYHRDRGGAAYGNVLDSRSHRLLCALIEDAADGPLPLPGSSIMPGIPPMARATALGVQYLFLFPTLIAGRLHLQLLPHVVESLREVRHGPPRVIASSMPAARAFLVDDAETVLVHARTHPIRVKANGRHLYKKDAASLEAILGPAQTTFGTADRLLVAVNALLDLEVLENGLTATSRRCLSVGTTAVAWLGQTYRERLDAFLGPMRTSSLSRRLEQMGVCDAYAIRDEEQGESIWKALLEMYARLPHEGGVSLVALRKFQVEDEGQADGFFTGGRGWWGEPWLYLTTRFLDWLEPRGGIVTSTHEDEDALIARTELGDYILGLRDSFPETEETTSRVIVQPNFDVVFLGPAPSAQSVFARFAERISTEAVGTVFRITRDSIMRAGAAGLTAEDIERSIEDIVKEVPPNVRHEIGAWISRIRRIKATSGILIECPDSDTAGRIERLAGKSKLQRVSTTALLALDRAALDRLSRKLADEGITVDLDLSADPKAKKKAKRRRRW